MRAEKTAMVSEFERRIAGAAFVLLTDYRGLTGVQMSALRAQLRGSQAEMHVVQNRLFRRVAASRKWEGMLPALRGPSAIVTGPDVIPAAKLLRKFL